MCEQITNDMLRIYKRKTENQGGGRFSVRDNKILNEEKIKNDKLKKN